MFVLSSLLSFASHCPVAFASLPVCVGAAANANERTTERRAQDMLHWPRLRRGGGGQQKAHQRRLPLPLLVVLLPQKFGRRLIVAGAVPCALRTGRERGGSSTLADDWEAQALHSLALSDRTGEESGFERNQSEKIDVHHLSSLSRPEAISQRANLAAAFAPTAASAASADDDDAKSFRVPRPAKTTSIIFLEFAEAEAASSGLTGTTIAAHAELLLLASHKYNNTNSRCPFSSSSPSSSSASRQIRLPPTGSQEKVAIGQQNSGQVGRAARVSGSLRRDSGLLKAPTGMDIRLQSAGRDKKEVASSTGTCTFCDLSSEEQQCESSHTLRSIYDPFVSHVTVSVSQQVPYSRPKRGES